MPARLPGLLYPAWLQFLEAFLPGAGWVHTPDEAYVQPRKVGFVQRRLPYWGLQVYNPRRQALLQPLQDGLRWAAQVVAAPQL